MELEIRPEPSPEEREAILKALERLLEGSPPRVYRSLWRRQGIQENLEQADDEQL